MGRYKEAPPGFECAYRDNCPHLGMSATYAQTFMADIVKDSRRHGSMEDAFRDEIQALEEELAVLAKENAVLKARLQAQHAARFKPSRKRQAPRKRPRRSASDRSPRPRGAPVGHPPWVRTLPDRIDRRVPVAAPGACPHCHTAALCPTGTTHTHRQEDIVLRPQTVITEYVHDLAYCPTCRREVFATATDELRNCQIGPVAKATAAYLRHAVKLSYRDVRLIFRDLFGLPFVPASAVAFDRTLTARGMPLYAQLREKIRAATVVHADETHWRIDGGAAYLWFGGTPHLAYYHIDHSRASAVAVSIFTDDFHGALCADAYAGYNAINARARQSCLAHLATKAKEIAAEIQLLPRSRRDHAALAMLVSLRAMFARACRTGAARNQGRISQVQARRYIPHFKNLLDTICLRPVAYENADQFRLRLLDPDREYDRMFTFLDVPGMEPTNNLAEQALRLPVIFRKICFGNRSDDGAQSLAVLLSLTATARRRQLDPRLFLQTLLTRGPEVAGPILFPESLPPLANSS